MVKPEEALPVTLDPEITVTDPVWLIPETTRLDASVEERLLSTLIDKVESDVEKVSMGMKRKTLQSSLR